MPNRRRGPTLFAAPSRRRGPALQLHCRTRGEAPQINNPNLAVCGPVLLCQPAPSHRQGPTTLPQPRSGPYVEGKAQRLSDRPFAGRGHQGLSHRAVSTSISKVGQVESKMARVLGVARGTVRLVFEDVPGYPGMPQILTVYTYEWHDKADVAGSRAGWLTRDAFKDGLRKRRSGIMRARQSRPVIGQQGYHAGRYVN
jgi:hypothetical protein